MITNFQNRNECKATGIITATVGPKKHERTIVRKDMAWGFASGERLLTAKEQEYCSQMNFEIEQAGEKS